MPELAFGQVGDEQPPVVHDERDVHPLPHLAKDVADDRVQEELAHLVLDRRDGLPPEPLVVALVLLGPERPDEGIFYLPDDLRAVRLVGQHPVDAEEGGVPAVQEGGHRVVQDVLQPRAPRVPPDPLERTDDPGGDEVAVVRRDVRQDVQADGELQVGRVEVHEVVGPLRRDVVQDLIREVAVRVDEADAVPEGDVLHDHVMQEGRLAAARLADDVDVLPLVGDEDAESLGPAPALALPDCDLAVAHGPGTSRHPLRPGCDVGDWRRQGCSWHAGEVMAAGAGIRTPQRIRGREAGWETAEVAVGGKERGRSRGVHSPVVARASARTGRASGHVVRNG